MNQNHINRYKEFYSEACKFMNKKDLNLAAEWWESFVEVIIRRMYFDSICECPYLGKFEVRNSCFRIKSQDTLDKERQEFMHYKTQTKVIPAFFPSDNFINDVNMSGVTREYKKRSKRHKLSHRDYLRMTRSEMLASNSNRHNNDDKIKKEFLNKMNKIKKEFAQQQKGSTTKITKNKETKESEEDLELYEYETE